MNRSLKFVLDIVMGALIPIAILTYMSEPLGNVRAYVIASLVPVSWVFIDLLFLTRRFNFITSYVGTFAVVNGLLAFWFVDGILYAFKDSVGFLLTITLFGGSVLLGRPFMRYFVIQILTPDTPERSQSLHALLAEPGIYRALVQASLIFAGINLLTGTANFLLNIFIVTAEFGTEQFNQQVAQVNAITRLALNIPEMLGMAYAVWLIIGQLYRHLPHEEGKQQMESEFWDLVRLREQGGPQELAHH
jgi:hypothetical protein